MELSTQLKINDKETCMQALEVLSTQSIGENIQRYVSSAQIIKLYDLGTFESIDAKTYVAGLPQEASEYISNKIALAYIQDKQDLFEAFNNTTELSLKEMHDLSEKQITELSSKEYHVALRKKFIEDLEFFPLYFTKRLNELAPDLMHHIFSYRFSFYNGMHQGIEQYQPSKVNIVQHLIAEKSSHRSDFENTQYLFQHFKDLIQKPTIDNVGTYYKEVSYFEFAIRNQHHEILQSFSPVFDELDQEAQHILVASLFNMAIPQEDDEYGMDFQIKEWPKSLQYYPYEPVYQHSLKFGHLLTEELNQEFQTMLLNKKLNVELDNSKASTSRFKV